MAAFRFNVQDKGQIEVLPPSDARRVQFRNHKTPVTEIVDAEFETVRDSRDFQTFPVFNDNRKNPQTVRKAPALVRSLAAVIRSVRRIEAALQSISVPAFAVMILFAFSLVFAATTYAVTPAIDRMQTASIAGPLEIWHLVTRLRQNNGMQILEISGLVVNRSQSDLSLPELAMAYAGDAGVSKNAQIRLDGSNLGAGASVGFLARYPYAGGKLPTVRFSYGTQAVPVR